MVSHFAPIPFYKPTTLRTETFTQSSFYAQIFLHREVCSQKNCCTQTPLRTDVFTQRRKYLHTKPFPQRSLCTELFFLTSLCGVLTFCSTSAAVRLRPPPAVPPSCLYHCINLSLSTCLCQLVSINLSLSTGLKQIVSINLSLSTARHLESLSLVRHFRLVQAGSGTVQTRLRLDHSRFRLFQTGSDTVQTRFTHASDTAQTGSERRFTVYTRFWFRHGSDCFRLVQTRLRHSSDWSRLVQTGSDTASDPDTVQSGSDTVQTCFRHASVQTG